MEVVALRRGVVRWLIKTGVGTLLIALALFLAAGRWDWLHGWLYVAVILAVQAVNVIVLLPRSPDLLAERSGVGEGAKPYDVLLAVLMAYNSLLAGLIGGLDERFGGSPEFAPWLVAAGVVVAVAGGLLTTWAMAANRFFSGVVRIQADRGHTVSDAGPYRLVRHPGYVGALLFALATPLVLGSTWALAVAALAVAVTFVRTALEDRVLHAELPGYAAYARRVRYRLLPGAW